MDFKQKLKHIEATLKVSRSTAYSMLNGYKSISQAQLDLLGWSRTDGLLLEFHSRYGFRELTVYEVMRELNLVLPTNASELATFMVENSKALKSITQGKKR